MKNSKLKKTDFIRSSKNDKLTQSVLRMSKMSWSQTLKNPNSLDVDNFSDKQLGTLASMNMEVFTKAAVKADISNDSENKLRQVFNIILGDVKKELEDKL